MSAMSEKARAKALDKVERLTRTGPGKVDASGWREPLGEDANVQTGMRPVSRRQFKRGGKVHGEKAPMHAGRKPRAKGGALTATSLINRDVKTANEDREGTKHIGGMKKGGRAHKDWGGSALGGGQIVGRGGNLSPAPTPVAAGAPPGKPVAMQRPIQRPGVRAFAKGGKAGHPRDCKCCGGSAMKDGGSVTDGTIEGTRPKGGRLARAGGGKAKKGMNVNIIIAPGGGGPKPMMGAPPMPPPGGPVGLHQGAPPPMPPPGAAPPMGPPMPPPQMRKRGGRTYPPIDSGAGGGLGRLEKIRAYG
jgi:hypothetical protein